MLLARPDSNPRLQGGFWRATLPSSAQSELTPRDSGGGARVPAPDPAPPPRRMRDSSPKPLPMCLAYPGRMRAPRLLPKPRPMCLAHWDACARLKLRPSCPAPCASPTRGFCARRDPAPRAPFQAPRLPRTHARPPRLRPASPAPCASLPRDACARRDSAPGARLPARPAPRSALPSGRRAGGGVSGGTVARVSRLRALVARCRPPRSGSVLGGLCYLVPLRPLGVS